MDAARRRTLVAMSCADGRLPVHPDSAEHLQGVMCPAGYWLPAVASCPAGRRNVMQIGGGGTWQWPPFDPAMAQQRFDASIRAEAPDLRAQVVIRRLVFALTAVCVLAVAVILALVAS